MGCIFSSPPPDPTISNDDGIRLSVLPEPDQESKPKETRSPLVKSIPKGYSVYMAQYDFDALSKDDLAFKKGDKLAVDEASTEGDWWRAHHLGNGGYGYIPRNYIQKDDGSVESQEYDGKEVLHEVEAGYRMPRPSGGAVPCPDAYYDVILQCWNTKPKSRPTFEYLHSCLSDFADATQGN